MLATFTTLLRICIFKAEPKDMPYSHQLLVSLIALKFITNYLILGRETELLKITGVQILVLTAVGIILSAAFVYALLRFKKLLNRFMQTFTALIAVDLIFKTAAYLFFVLLAQHSLVQLVWLLYLWNLLAISFVIARALEIRLILSLFIIIAFNLFVSTVVQGIIAL